MARHSAFLPWILLVVPSTLLADPDADTPRPRLTNALAVESAMSRARENLQANKPAEAVAVLEAQILYVNGNASYLALMKDAYIAYLKELKRINVDVDRIEHVCRQIRILDPKVNLDEITPATGVVNTPAPAIEEKSPTSNDNVVNQPQPMSVETKSVGDPFQQSPLDRMPVKGNVKLRAREAFEQKRYAEAAELFAQAYRAKIELSEQEKQAWGYARLDSVVKKMAPGNFLGSSLPSLETETEEAMNLGGPALKKYAQDVLDQIRSRKSKLESPSNSVAPEGWQVFDSGSFRVYFQKSRPQAEEVAKAAERARALAYETWSGPVETAGTPRCDVWLHNDARDYAKITNKPESSPGHASIGTKSGRVVARRIDLRNGDADMMTSTLPREVAYVVLSCMFPEQPLPRWADVGMTKQAEAPTEISRYRRAVPKLAKERKLYSLHDLLKMAEFPEADKITAFYVESVSLVDFLVKLKGPKAFALYLREAPRRGYEEALQRHYGFKDASELQERWMKFAMAGE